MVLRNYETTLKLLEIENLFQWTKWTQEIPYINFPPDWEVQITPPTLGAIIRFRVKRKDSPSKQDISIYLDCYDYLGSYGSPYWEIYPDEEGNLSQYPLNNTQDLLTGIEKALCVWD